MSGERDLKVLLGSMQPKLGPETYVFCTVDKASKIKPANPLMMFQEAEGTTFILTRTQAEKEGIKATFPCRCITLNIHSALDAVGFIAVIATKLADAGMGVNPVAGYFHDHLFVPEERAEDAMRILKRMAQDAS